MSELLRSDDRAGTECTLVTVLYTMLALSIGWLAPTARLYHYQSCISHVEVLYKARRIPYTILAIVWKASKALFTVSSLEDQKRHHHGLAYSGYGLA